MLTDASITTVANNCPSLATLEVRGCSKLTDASITAVASNSPSLTTLEVELCEKLTDVSITAVAEKYPRLEELNVSGCRNLTDASITAVAEKCPASLTVNGCRNLTDASLAAVAGNCPRLTELDVNACSLTALPSNIGRLSKLRTLSAHSNRLEELPLSIVDLDASCALDVRYSPLQTPPFEIARRGIRAIRQYWIDDAS